MRHAPAESAERARDRRAVDDASGHVAVLSPVRLQEDAVDLLEVDGLRAVADVLKAELTS
jgi:hypothetical protein